MTNDNTLAAAIDYAGRGFHVFPCKRGKKTPATAHGLKDASRNSDQLNQWFSESEYNIAIVGGPESNLAVIDEDTYAGGDLAALERDLGKLPPTLEAKTRAAGRHLFFSYPEGSILRSFNGKIAPHIDLKAQGGYVIAAPSWVEADDKGPAGSYAWVNNLPIAALPEAWRIRWESLGAIEKSIQDTKRVSAVAALAGYTMPERVEEGSRNSALVAYCGHLRGKGMPDDLILEAARDFSRARFIPPLDDDEVVKVAEFYAKPSDNDLRAWPDPKPITAPLPPVEPFDYRLLPARFRPYVEDQADLMQAEPDFIAAPMMVAAAATIGNGFAIAPKARDVSWLVSSVLWGGVVGRSAVMKTPTLQKATHPLSILEAEMQQAFDQRKAQYALEKAVYEVAMATAKKAPAGSALVTPPVEPVEPKPERIMTNDSTYQVLGEILRHSPRGVLVLRDEVTAMLESLTKEGQEEARGFYLEGWNGHGSYRIDRIGRGSFMIPRFALWVFGGIQPGRLQAYIREAVSGGNGDDGLMQRFQMLVWPDTSKPWKNVDRSPDVAAAQDVVDTFKALRKLDPVAIGARVDPIGGLPAYLHFTSEAQQVFNAYRMRLETTLRGDDRHAAIESHLAKYRSLVPALALVIHLVDGGTGPVTLDALSRAIDWSRYLWSHAQRVYASVTNATGFGAKALADKISNGKLENGFTAREVRRHGWQFLTTVDDVRDALEWLVDAGWIRATRTAGEDGGRPSYIHTINPKVPRRVSAILAVPHPHY